MAAHMRLLPRCLWTAETLVTRGTTYFPNSNCCTASCSVVLTRQRSCSASILRLKKDVYPLMYKVRVVEPDGSSYMIRHHSPKKLILLPIDPSTLTAEELLARQKILRPEKSKLAAPVLDAQDSEIQKKSWKRFVKRKN